jgi:hypothetical protein
MAHICRTGPGRPFDARLDLGVKYVSKRREREPLCDGYQAILSIWIAWFSFERYLIAAIRLLALGGKMVCRVIALCILTLGIELSAAHSAQLDPQQIKLISDTAVSICKTVKDIKGEKTYAQIQGEVKGQLSGLLGKLSGTEASASGTGTLSREAFEGLTQDATATSLIGDRECRMNSVVGELR